jgi:hypothetical protein
VATSGTAVDKSFTRLEALAVATDLGIDFKVLTRDHEAGSEEPASWRQGARFRA